MLYSRFSLVIYFIEPITQMCPTLCGPMDCSIPDSSIHGIFQASILEWVAISFSISTLYIVSKCIYVSCNHPVHPIPHHPLGIHMFVPYIYLYFCFVNKIVYTSFFIFFFFFRFYVYMIGYSLCFSLFDLFHSVW